MLGKHATTELHRGPSFILRQNLAKLFRPRFYSIDRPARACACHPPASVLQQLRRQVGRITPSSPSHFWSSTPGNAGNIPLALASLGERPGGCSAPPWSTPASLPLKTRAEQMGACTGTPACGRACKQRGSSPDLQGHAHCATTKNELGESDHCALTVDADEHRQK